MALLLTPADAAGIWRIDFQGDENGFSPQGIPLDAAGHNIFEVPALDGNPSSFETNPSLALIDDEGNPGVLLSFTGDTVGWAGSRGNDALLRDYLILFNAFGVDSSTLDFTLTGLQSNTPYVMTFFAHDDGNSNRATRFEINGGTLVFSQSNADGPASHVVFSDAAGVISGTAMNAGAEGNWAGLHVLRQIPEPSTFALTALGLLSLVMLGRRHRRR